MTTPRAADHTRQINRSDSRDGTNINTMTATIPYACIHRHNHQSQI